MVVRVPVTKKMATTAAKVITKKLGTEDGANINGVRLRSERNWTDKWCREIYDLDHSEFSVYCSRRRHMDGRIRSSCVSVEGDISKIKQWWDNLRDQYGLPDLETYR